MRKSTFFFLYNWKWNVQWIFTNAKIPSKKKVLKSIIYGEFKWQWIVRMTYFEESLLKIALNWSKRRATCNTNIIWSALRRLLWYDSSCLWVFFFYYNNFKLIFTTYLKTPDLITRQNCQSLSDLIFSSHAAG